MNCRKRRRNDSEYCFDPNFVTLHSVFYQYIIVPSYNGEAFNMHMKIKKMAILFSVLAVSLPTCAIASNDADTPMKTPAGVVVTAPKAWVLENTKNTAILRAPEGDFTIAVVDVATAADVRAASIAAWTIYRPNINRKIQQITPRPAKDGWDERQVIDYETSPNEKIVVQAVAYRKDKSWTVVIFEGSQSTAEKRGAALTLISQSIRPEGYAAESFMGRTAHPLDAERVAALRAFVQESMDKLGVPGASIALIDKGKVVFEGGFGVRELGKPEPVDASTRFMVASNTKGLSTLLLAQMVDKGKVQWNDPVVKIYRSFRLGNEATTQKVLVRNLVCACTGLPRNDLQWLFNTPKGTPATTTFDQLAATQPTSGFGEVFQYNNLMASAAGYVAGHLAYPQMELGAAYDTAMQTHIFKPLGMRDTTFSMKAALAGNFAQPYGDGLDGKPMLADMSFNHTITPYRPAGAAWSSARDMIKYVQLELAQGTLPNGRRIVSAKNLLARRAHGVPTGEASWYGMGLMDDKSWGVSVIHHGGSLIGYKSDIMLIPDANIGAVILTNSDTGRAMLRPFMRRLLELLYDGKPEAVADIDAAAKLRSLEMAKFMERLVIPPDSAVTAALAKSYSNPALGRLDIRMAGKDVVFALTSGSSRVASRKNDDGTISLIWTDPAIREMDFVVGQKDGKPTLTTRDAQHEYVFTAN
jgi:CubicO group peptidase (beta-lactamase class C family)